jgi:glycosyltransferase involved in cell wall biosynthesis
MRRLAIIPNDPIDLYLSSGYGASWLKDYFNPNHCFDEVYSLAPWEQVDGDRVGVIAMPTDAQHLHGRLSALHIDVVRAYGGTHSCALACRDKVSGIPVVVSVHDTSPDLLDPAIAAADVVLCVSTAVARLVGPHLPHDRLWLLPNRVDFSVMRRLEGADTSDLDARYPFRHRVLHVGRKSRQKNLDNLIKAIAALGPDYCLIASGKGAVDEYEKLAEEAGVRNRIFFVDAIPNEELPRYFSWADCMCNPSRWEGMSIVLIEALAAGTILVTSDIPEISESVTDRHNGLLVRDYESPLAIASAIRAACTDEELRRTLRANARPSVEQFERSRIDALEAGYYLKVLDLRDRGLFNQPLATRVGRSVARESRRMLPASVKNAIRPLVTRRSGEQR